MLQSLLPRPSRPLLGIGLAAGALAAFAVATPAPAAPTQTGDLELEFLGEATLPTGFRYDFTEVGGLSGLDYDPASGTYLALSDDRAQLGLARFYDLTIDLSDGELADGDVEITAVTQIVDEQGSTYLPGTLDPEALRRQAFPELLFWADEGDASQGIGPSVRIMTRDGQPVSSFVIPDHYAPTSEDHGIRNNLAFESLTFNRSGSQTIVATENALAQDGPAASLEAGSPTRVLWLDNASGLPHREHVYVTEPIAEAPEPADGFATNGLVELLVLDETRLLAIERSFSVGRGNHIELFVVSTDGATDVRHLDSLAGVDVVPMVKTPLLDLDELGITLDNIEGVTFGPEIDGAPTLVLVSDNNFNAVDQFTQFLAFRLG